jgi:hypothetical protein
MLLFASSGRTPDPRQLPESSRLRGRPRPHPGKLRITMATATASRPTAERPRFALTERDLRQYLERAILTSADNQEGSSRRAESQCFEMEVSETIARSHTGENHGGALHSLEHWRRRECAQGSEEHPDARWSLLERREVRTRTQVHRPGRFFGIPLQPDARVYARLETSRAA